MALTDKLTAVANAIRAKTGGTEAMTLAQMPAEIGSIAGTERIHHQNIPGYVKEAVCQVAEKVRAVQTANTVTFVALADFHYAGVQSDTGWQNNINTGNLHAVQAVKALSYALGFDFAAVLGDTSFGSSTTTQFLLKSQVSAVHNLLDESLGGIPAFFTPGNHDTGRYCEPVGAAFLKQAFADRCVGANYGDTVYGYCYRDFDDKKLRVICLNSSEGETNGQDDIFSSAQLLWFAQTLYDLGCKADAADWRVMILSHYPLDYGGAYTASNVLAAYVNGTSGTWNGTTVDFSGVNSPRVVCNLHGHTHCFKVDNLHSVTNQVATAYDAKRAAVPNACFYRSNEAGQNESTEWWGVEFGEERTYNKLAGTAQDTAFLVGVDDPDNQLLHLFCYGAGYDRTVSYGRILYYTITNTLVGASTDNSIQIIAEGSPYRATISAAEGYDPASLVISVKMGGAAVADGLVQGGVISIPSVTGSIEITATAQKLVNYTNLVNLAVDSSGNPAPYTDDTYISSSGNTGSLSGFVSTGFIPFDGGAVHTYRIGGEDISWNEYGARIGWYKADFTRNGDYVESYDSIGVNMYHPAYIEDANAAAAFVTDENFTYPAGAAYFRISAKGLGQNLIVTLDEPIA